MENKNNDLRITYLCDAPREMVFKAWTDPEQLAHWYAPEGCAIEFKSLDVRIGGGFHSVIRDPKHGDCWIKGRYSDVVVPERLVFSMILSNENGDSVRSAEAGKSDAWPEAIVTTVIFVSIGSQTKIILHQTVDEAEAKKTGAYQSWFSMFDKLTMLLRR